MPYYVYLNPYDTNDIITMGQSTVKQKIDREIELKIESFKKSEEGKNKILYEKIYWYLDEFSCVLVRRNKKWFEKVFPKILDVSKTIERERVEGFEHRASTRVKKTKSAT
jgi:hypothetical protein